MLLQARLAFEAVRTQRATAKEFKNVASAVLMTTFMTEAGHGILELQFVRRVERDIYAILDTGGATGEWMASGRVIEELGTVINEYDRQLREVRLGVVKAAAERLDRMINAAISRGA